MTKANCDRYFDLVTSTDPIRSNGKVTQVIGLVIESIGPAGSIGDLCYIHSKNSSKRARAEIVGFRGNRVLLMPLGNTNGIGPGSEVTKLRDPLTVSVDNSLLGRVVNGFGQPIDNKGPLMLSERRSVHCSPPNPLERKRVTEPITTGIRAIDTLLTLGKGQRTGIFAGSGVGKSVLMGMIARNTSADVNVIGLIGERGREVRDFIERDLQEEGLERSVVVVVTSDQEAQVRLKGALTATAIAEHFRDQGWTVMLMMDSITRVAMAQREVGLAIGEPPTTKGYTPSVFAFLPKLLERAGNSSTGSITGLYTVLVEGDDMTEPVADMVRSNLDGHIVLSRKMASMNHYPAIDVLESISRVMPDVVEKEHLQAAYRFKEILAIYREAEDLINIGAYVQGSNPRIDYALSKIKDATAFLKQGIDEESCFHESVDQMMAIGSESTVADTAEQQRG